MFLSLEPEPSGIISAPFSRLGTYADRIPAAPLSEEVPRPGASARYADADPGTDAVPPEYPRSSLPGADDFFYWNMGEFGMKPTTRLNHVVIQGIVKLKLTAVFDAQHGGFTTGWIPVSWGSIDELLVNLTMHRRLPTDKVFGLTYAPPKTKNQAAVLD